MVAYALKLTTMPAKVRRDEIEQLKEAGWSDREIFRIALVTSWYNFLNRMADGLGYGPDSQHRFTPESP